MKRYWKLITIATVIVLVIGTFYIQSSLAASKYPNFTFEKKSGNESEVKGLTVYGLYKGEGAEDYLNISAEKTTYNSRISFFDRLNGAYISPDVLELQEEYPNFMRGKNKNFSGSFFENETSVAYANVDWEYNNYRPTKFTFDIEILNKDSKEKTAFKIAVPDQGKYNNMYVEGVLVNKGEILIATTNYLDKPVAGTDNKEMHIYRLDINTKQLIDDQIVRLFSDNVESGWTSTFMLKGDNNQGPHNYILFAKQVRFHSDENGDDSQQIELIAYNLETNEQVPLKLPNEIGHDAFPSAFSGSTIYFSEIVDHQVEISLYDIDSKKVETKQFEQVEELDGFQFRIKNDNLYMINQLKAKKEKASISVIDISTGDSLYEGAIVRDIEDNTKEIYSLSFEGMEISGNK